MDRGGNLTYKATSNINYGAKVKNRVGVNYGTGVHVENQKSI